MSALEGNITERGTVHFTVTASEQNGAMEVRFAGTIRADHPHRHLAAFLENLEATLRAETRSHAVLDFTGLRFCNSNGFYVLMDVAQLVYRHVSGRIAVRHRKDDWHRETLPILLDLEEDEIRARTSLEEVS